MRKKKKREKGEAKRRGDKKVENSLDRIEILLEEIIVRLDRVEKQQEKLNVEKLIGDQKIHQEAFHKEYVKTTMMQMDQTLMTNDLLGKLADMFLELAEQTKKSS